MDQPTRNELDHNNLAQRTLAALRRSRERRRFEAAIAVPPLEAEVFGEPVDWIDHVAPVKGEQS